MKSLILAVVVSLASMSFAFAHSGAQSDQTKSDEIKVVREWK